MVLDSITRTDLLAHHLLRAWSAPVVTHRRVSPCARPSCGGSILLLGGDAHCLLCARASGGGGSEVTSAKLAKIAALTQERLQSLADDAD